MISPQHSGRRPAALALLAVMLVLRPVQAQDVRHSVARERAAALATAHLEAAARQRGITLEFRIVDVTIDDRANSHTRVQQLFNGIRVFGAEAIVHAAGDGKVFGETSTLIDGITVNTEPALTATEAVARARTHVAVEGTLSAPTSDLWILRREGRDHLAYRVRFQVSREGAVAAIPVVFVDAHDGRIVWNYDDLRASTAVAGIPRPSHS
jgi:Zn-dependent metalloprotease